MDGYSGVSSSRARMSGTKTNVFISLLIVSMFLLASVAIVTDVSVADAKPKEVGTIHITEKGIEAEGWTEGTDYEYVVEDTVRTLTLKGGSYVINGDSAIDYQTPGVTRISLAGDVSIKSAIGIVGKTPFVITGHGTLTMDCSGPAFNVMMGLSIVPNENSEVKVNVNSTVSVSTSPTIYPGATLNIDIKEDKPAIKSMKVMMFGGNLFIRSTSDVPAIDAFRTDVRGGTLCIDSHGACSSGEVAASVQKGNIPFVYAHSDKSTFTSFSVETAGIVALGSKDGYDWRTLSNDLPSYVKIGVPVDVGYKLEQTEGGKISFLDPKIDGKYRFLVNEPVVLKVVADQGYEFKQWSDGSTEHPCHLVFTSADGNTYSATFEAEPPGDQTMLASIVLVIAFFCAIGILVTVWKKD